MYANLLLNVLYHIEIEMKIRESCLQTGNFIYKPGISLTKQDFHLQRGSLGLQRGFSGYYLPLEIFIKPLSLCMRLFGNVLGSFVIMELLKMVVPAIVPAVFSCYFDIFDGLIQAYVFVFLTGLFIKEATE